MYRKAGGITKSIYYAYTDFHLAIPDGLKHS